MNIKDKNILITGASKGIGKALAYKLASLGANVGIIARSMEELSFIQNDIVSKGGNCQAFCGDVSDTLFVKSCIKNCEDLFGKIDIMVNNAGYGIFGKIEDLDPDAWSALFDTNVKGTFLFSQGVIPTMKKNGGGHIINIASDVAKRVFPGGSLYCASKYAQDAFSAALRKEVRKDGIKVSVVYSGLVDSMFHERKQGDEHHKEWLSCDDMADSIIFIMNQPKHVVIDELMIHPLSQDY